MIAFTVYGKPQPAGSKRAFQHRHTGRIVVTDASKGSRPWKTDVSENAGVAMTGRSELLDGPLLLEITFWMPRPKGHFGANGVRPSAPRFPTVKPDLLKLARAVEDAMSGVVYRDDSQIVTETLQKAYGEPARCEIRVVPVAHDLVEAPQRVAADAMPP